MTPDALFDVLRKCRLCEESKPPDQFYERRRICKTCNDKRARGWAANNPERHAKNARNWQKRNPDKVLNGKLKRKYGITLDEYLALHEAQGGLCLICERTCRTGERLAVDHCHETGRVRGLLCRGCNVVLGLMQDNPELLTRAANYLKARPMEG